MSRNIDFAVLALNLAVRRGRTPARNLHSAIKAINLLRGAGLPEAYVDGIQDEVLEMLCDGELHRGSDHVYLAFHGHDGRASHMKIGVARDVKKRMAALFTGNPLPRLWVFSAAVRGRDMAALVEKELLRHMSSERSSGEWVRVDGVSEAAAIAIAESLAEVASLHAQQPISFARHRV